MNAEALFHEALSRPPAERPTYLAAACAGDEALRGRVEALLRAHENPGSFLAGRPPAPAETVDAPPAEGPGTQIGPYRLLARIGEGGFGVVYMAEQTEPVRRKVALKVLKPGMDSRQVVARFEAERQALALMDHPHIARVFDGGATGSGRPYFVMELVKGAPITDFCDQNRLPPRDRLTLFADVCRAVQHAHQKGVIHRDLKPSNVLVSRHDTTPIVKVIDFGVAKALGQELTDKTLFTGVAQMVGTPLYMSPEQAGMSDLDVDTRSDIYSLGVLLYELLTGTTPFTKDRFKKAAFDEIRRIIREEEPPRPSTRLSTAEELPSVAAQRQTEPAKLTRLVRGELDWIVMRCLEKDRNRRYETAAGLAAEVGRYLAGEPVQAVPPSAGYRLRKFVRRNRAAVAAVAAVVAAVLAGFGVSTWQAVRAVRAERLAADRLGEEELARRDADSARAAAQTNEARAVAAAGRATAVADLLQRMLESANPERARKAGVTVRELLDEFAAGLGDRLKDQPGVEAAIRDVIGRAYWRLGLNDEAAPHLERAVALRRQAPGADPKPLAASLAAWGRVLFEQRKPGPARAALEEALALHRQAGSPAGPVIETLVSLQMLARSEKRAGEADRLVAQARELARALPGGDDSGLACMLHVQAFNRRASGRPDEAEPLAREAVAMHRRTRRPTDLELAHGLFEWGRCLHALKRDDEAEAPVKEALAIFRVHLPDDHSFVTSAQETLLAVLRARGREAEADALAQDHARRLLAQSGKGVRDLKGWLDSANASRAAKDWEQARHGYREAAKLAGPADPAARSQIGHGLRLVAAGLREQGKQPEAMAAYWESAAAFNEALRLAKPGDSTRDLRRDAYQFRALDYSDLERHAEAAEDWGRAAELAAEPQRVIFRSLRIYHLVRAGRAGAATREADDLDMRGNVTALCNTASAYAVAARRGDRPDGPGIEEHYARRAVELLRQAAAAGHPNPLRLAEDDDLDALRGRSDFRAVLAEMAKGTPQAYSGALAILGHKLLGRGQFAAAEPVLRECVALREKEGPDDWRTFNARALLGGALLGQKRYAEAEPLLVDGYQGMKQRREKIPVPGRDRLTEALERLAQLSDALGKTGEAARWREELAAVNKNEPGTGRPAPEKKP